ncbi:MAG: hypothetical protein MUO61_02025 [Dehalococcoidia bacterium]|nr:hypothetical protein [Dehalococcoidia bacterium]
MISLISLYHLLSAKQLAKRRTSRNSEMLTPTAVACQQLKDNGSVTKSLTEKLGLGLAKTLEDSNTISDTVSSERYSGTYCTCCKAEMVTHFSPLHGGRISASCLGPA